MPRREAKTPLQGVEAWMDKLRFSRKHSGAPPPGDNALARLAGLLRIMGRPEPGSEAAEIGNSFIRLFIGSAGRNRTKYWAKVLDDFPAEPAMIRRVHRCVQAHTRHAESQAKFTIETDRLKLDKVVEAMLEIPKPDLYVRHTMNAFSPRPRVMFHPNTVDVVKDQLKGLTNYDGSAREKSLLEGVPVD